VVESLVWFHPVVWWIGGRLVVEREQACDEHVVTATSAPLAYAEGIVNVCRRYVETPLMSVAGVGGKDVKARIETILTNRFGRRLTVAKSFVLASAAVVSFVVPMAAGAIEAAAFAAGQVPRVAAGGRSIDPQMRFEVVSIKLFDSVGGAQPRMAMNPGRYDVIGMPLRLVVGQGLAAPLDRIFGWPDWIDTERYTIAAKMQDGPPPATGALFVMIENLLKDRFNLVTHRETRELPIYNLVVAHPDRLGPALKESSRECRTELTERVEAARRGAPMPTTPAVCMTSRLNVGTASMDGTQMAVLANFLTQSVGRPVIDRTGLTSFYDLTLKWTPNPGGGPTPFGLPAGLLPTAPPPPEDPNAPNIFTAVQEQLGLKLEAGRGPVEVVIIDRLDKPTLD